MDPQALYQRACELHQSGAPEEAASLYRRILELDPAHAGANLNLASLLFDQGEIGEAERMCLTVRERDKRNAAAELLLSRIAFLDGRADDGFRHISDAFAFAPTNPSIRYEYGSALRRRYWTYRPDEFRALFARARAAELPSSDLTRLTHQCFARIVRPRLIELISASGSDAVEEVIERWAEELAPAQMDDLKVILGNLEALVAAYQERSCPQSGGARLTLRDGSVLNTTGLADADPLTHGALELLGSEGMVAFVPFAELQECEFGEPEAYRDATLLYRGGELVRGFAPSFYLFTEFCDDTGLLEGRMTLFKTLTPNVRLPVGMRAWVTDESLVPMLNVAKIEFL